MKPGDKYYDGPVVDSGKSVEELEQEYKEEAKRLEGQMWPSEYTGE